jgi:hypothetical protein
LHSSSSSVLYGRYCRPLPVEADGNKGASK